MNRNGPNGGGSGREADSLVTWVLLRVVEAPTEDVVGDALGEGRAVRGDLSLAAHEVDAVGTDGAVDHSPVNLRYLSESFSASSVTSTMRCANADEASVL
jgi:hypothetical protein